MREDDEFKESLRAGTRLVVEASRGSIPIEQFIEEYANFYYAEALDGHEEGWPSTALLAEYKEIVTAHQAVQLTVVDITFIGPPEQQEQYFRAGRISAEQARQRLERIVKEHDLERYVENP